MKTKWRMFSLAFVASLLMWAASPAPLWAQSYINITSPSSGMVEQLGATFSVVYTSDPSVTNLAVVGDFLGSFSQTRAGSNAFSVTVSANTRVGIHQLYVAGTINGQIIASPPISITVDTPQTITSIQISPRTVLVQVAKSVHLYIAGMLSDGTTAFLNESPQISYASANAAVATVSGRGAITGVAPGSTNIIVSGPNGLSYTVAVLVPGAPQLPPVLSPTPGSFVGPQQITIIPPTGGAALYYTVDGSQPTTKSMPYGGPFTISSSTALNALAVGSAGRATAWGTYTITAQPVAATPTFTPVGGTSTSVQTVTIADTTSGAAIYYTTNGTAPTASSILYGGPITVSSTETVQAIAVANGYSNSPVASAAYTINLPQDFTFGLSASSLSIAPGKSGSLTASVSPLNGFSQPVSFACSGLPSGTTCSFSPATLTSNGTASGTTTVTITASATAGLLTGNRPYELAGLAAGLSLLFARRRFRRLGGIGLLLLLMIGVGSFVSCGGGSSTTKPTTSTVSINATSGSSVHTASLSLTIN